MLEGTENFLTLVRNIQLYALRLKSNMWVFSFCCNGIKLHYLFFSYEREINLFSVQKKEKVCICISVFAHVRVFTYLGNFHHFFLKHVKHWPIWHEDNYPDGCHTWTVMYIIFPNEFSFKF